MPAAEVSSTLPITFDDGTALIVSRHAGGRAHDADRYAPFPAYIVLTHIDKDGTEKDLTYVPGKAKTRRKS